jgi:hypothetical protein
MSDPIIVPLPVYYGTSDTRNGRPVFPKTGLFYTLAHRARLISALEVRCIGRFPCGLKRILT